MQEKYEQLQADVNDEVKNIEQVLTDISSLINRLDLNKIDRSQKTALGAFLMNFYTGVENIIKRISKEYYQTIPKGESWHKELLDLSCKPPQGKLPIFNQDIVIKLNQYRKFRHFFVSGYGFKLDFSLMKPLIEDINEIWRNIQKAITEFFDKL